MEMMFIQLAHFHLLRPWWLLAIIPLVYILYSLKNRQDNLHQWRAFMSASILDSLTVMGNDRKVLSPVNLSACIGILCIVVLTGPTWKQQPSPFTEDKSALIIALDVSQSMEQTDLLPTRLIRAKQKIIELLDLRGDANTALIAYAGSAHTVMPITNDKQMIKQFLDSLGYQLMPHSGKQPQTILPIANRLLAATNVPGTILMIGDGVSEGSEPAFDAFFETASHQLIIWGIGKDNANQLESGSNIIPMQTQKLQQLTDTANGRFVLLTDDKQDISEVNRYIENNLIVSEDESRPWLDAGYSLVFFIAFLYLFWFRRGWTIEW